MSIDLVRLSKTVSHALRHAPAEYGLTLDADGWVPIGLLFRPAIRGVSQPRSGVALAHRGGPRRDDRPLSEDTIRNCRGIRALYGHSTPERLEKEPVAPPKILFHGTDPKAAAVILDQGLKPMSRQYAHLSRIRW